MSHDLNKAEVGSVMDTVNRKIFVMLPVSRNMDYNLQQNNCHGQDCMRI